MLFPAASVNAPSAIDIDLSPSPLGVNTALYIEPDPVKEEREPPLAEISSKVKSVVVSLGVKVKSIVGALVFDPLDIPTGKIKELG